jgi:hypothetical protein
MEQALEGGCQTDGVVRVGETVRRPLHARSEYVHSVLEHLASVGFDGAPRLLGVDEIGTSFRRARDNHAACGRAKAVAIFEEMMIWMERNGPELKAASDDLRLLTGTAGSPRA